MGKREQPSKEPPKKKLGRPPGSKDKKPRKRRTTAGERKQAQKIVKQISVVAKDSLKFKVYLINICNS
jgi:hypothetical protein